MDGEPFEGHKAKSLLLEILAHGTVNFSKHAREEMEKDGLVEIDVENILRGGRVEFPELKNGTWRYRVKTNRMCAVAGFRSETKVTIVTAWRLKT